jgi:two-component system sensor histidine kinase YesM
MQVSYNGLEEDNMMLRGWGQIRRSIFAKFVMAFIGVGLIPFILLGYWFLDGLSRQAESFNDSSLNQMLLYLAKSTDQLYDRYNQITQTLYLESRYGQMRVALEQDNHSVIEDQLVSILSSDSDIENVYFMPSATAEMLLVTRKAKLLQTPVQPDQTLRAEMLQGGTEFMFLGVHPDLYNPVADLQVMTFGRNLIDKETVYDEEPHILGTLLLDVRTDVLNPYFRELSIGRQDHVSLLDRDGRIYYSTSKSLTGQLFFERSHENSAIERMEAQPIEATGHWLVGSFSKKDFFGVISQFKTVSIPVMVLSLGFLVLLSFMMSRRLSRPIRNMIHHMGQMEAGNLKLQMPVESQDELGQLVRGMNRMSGNLHEHIQVAYVARMKQERAELDALKSQIRPHYLYNTLEVIRMNAIQNDDDSVADMIQSLASQLDYVIDYGESIVCLADELSNVRHYFELIKMMYEERVELRMTIAPEIQPELGIIKLSIQPLVENAVEHGLLKKPEGGVVNLRVYAAEGRLVVIEVEDNGIGINDEQLRKINETMIRDNVPADNAERDSHRGIQNVHGRIRALCGAAYGLEINSRPGLGTISRHIG